MDRRLISIVVPVYNEQGSLGELIAQIDTTTKEHELHTEVIFVDDGSTDGSWQRIVELSEKHSNVGGLKFTKNEGKAAALMAGFAAAQGDVVITMDADLQDPPQEIPNLLAKLDAGFDVVSGWKRTRHDPWHKVFPSRIFNWMIGQCTGVRLHDHVCGLKCYRGEVVKKLRIYGEFHRFLGVFAAAEGYRVTEIETLHRPRTIGVGKYGISRFAKGFIDMLTVTLLTRYRWRPQHVLGAVAFVIIFLEMLVPTFSEIESIVIHELSYAVRVTLRVFVFGLLFVALGFVAALMVHEHAANGLYTVVQRAGVCVDRKKDEPHNSQGISNKGGGEVCR